MLKLKKTGIIAVAFLAFFMLSTGVAFAHGHGYHSYFFHGGRWHSHGWFGFDIAVGIPPIGAIVPALPSGYVSVIIGGMPYYCYGNAYFSPCPGGYIVVPAPEPTPSSTQDSSSNVKEGDTITINIPNSKGGFTPVRLIKHNGGYIGPEGEFYFGHPSVEQLKTLYGE